MSSFNKIAKFLAAEMKVIDPTRQQSKLIVKKLRDYFGINFVKDPVFRKYITKRDAKSNKFHYFGVLETKDGKFAVANVYGRIGYPKPQIKELGIFDSKADAMTAAKKKLTKKLSAGYQETKLPN